METLEFDVIDAPTLLMADELEPVIPLELPQTALAPHLTRFQLEVAGLISAHTLGAARA